MFDRILKRIRENFQDGNYFVTRHAQFEMYDDGLTMLDVERAVFNGTILERQRDEETSEPSIACAASLKAMRLNSF